MISITYTGDISKTEYDKVVDIDRVEFTDKTAKTDCYIEIPRLNSQISIQDKKNMTVLITDDEKEVAKIKDPLLIFNSVLYMVRKSTDPKPKDIVQFSAGGIILRIMSDKQTTFRMRGNRNFKLVIK